MKLTSILGSCIDISTLLINNQYILCIQISINQRVSSPIEENGMCQVIRVLHPVPNISHDHMDKQLPPVICIYSFLWWISASAILSANLILLSQCICSFFYFLNFSFHRLHFASAVACQKCQFSCCSGASLNTPIIPLSFVHTFYLKIFCFTLILTFPSAFDLRISYRHRQFLWIISYFLI